MIMEQYRAGCGREMRLTHGLPSPIIFGRNDVAIYATGRCYVPPRIGNEEEVLDVPRALQRQGYSGAPAPKKSDKAFPDGADFRLEIPSVEGPRVLAAVLAQADRYGLAVNRVSQGSGGMLLEESELRESGADGERGGPRSLALHGPPCRF